jgi:hypothetical protein
MSPPRDLHAQRADHQAFWRVSRAWDSSVACSFQTNARKSSAASGRVDLQSRVPYLGAGLEGNCQLHGSHNVAVTTTDVVGLPGVGHRTRVATGAPEPQKLRRGYALAHSCEATNTHVKFQTFILICLEFETFISTQVEMQVELDLNKRSIHIRGSYHGANARGGVHVTPLFLGHGGLQIHE